MSIIDGISRFGAQMARARRASRAARRMNELPEELQRDIGWPLASADRRKAELFAAIWDTQR